jgi:polysaccharide export outer membrane protein
MLAVLVALLVGIGGAFAQQTEAPAKPKTSDTYRLQPGDEVVVSVLPQKEYDTGGAILPDGNLNLKNVGEISASGMTIKQLQEVITKELDKELRNPVVTVTVIKLGNPLRPKVTVTGAVTKAGPLDLEDGLRVRKAIELAGGELKDADLAKVTVRRRDLTRMTVDLSDPERSLDPKVNLLLEDGDSVDVPLLPNRISVGGSVKMGGLLALERDLRVRKAIDIAGGAAPEADLTKVVIIHRDLSKTVVDVSTEDKITDPKQNPLLVDGDSVQVPALFKTGVVTVNGPGVSVPATVELTAGMALEELVVNVGKPTTLANLEQVSLRRADKTEKKVSIAPNSKSERVLLEPGDTVYVEQYNNRVYFLAPIPTAGQRPLKPGQKLASFLQEIQDPGALDGSKVDLKNAKLVQNGSKKPLKIDVYKILSNENDKNNVELTPGDVIVIPPKEPKGPKNEWMRNIPYLGTILTLLL